MELLEQLDVVCPYCGETVSLIAEADLGGELIQDCEVCCNPWRLRLTRAAGALRADVARLDD